MHVARASCDPGNAAGLKSAGVQLSKITEKLNGVTDGATGKRSAGSHFYPYRTRIGSHI